MLVVLEVLVVGGDFNAHIGGGEARNGVCGCFGLRESNEQGEELKNKRIEEKRIIDERKKNIRKVEEWKIMDRQKNEKKQ